MRRLVLEVGTRPRPGERRQVVRRHRGQRLNGEALGFAVLEPDQPVAEDSALGKVLAHLVLDGAEVFTDDERPGALALESQQVEELACG